ncbi:MAG: hypothetical protein DHS20C13_19940 [Thermodesulfobacteriota bacterium]|nr:MAG: hypothetical protein DHS20C13_19940 [Thermodesulfobacteriota bacterium]
MGKSKSFSILSFSLVIIPLMLTVVLIGCGSKAEFEPKPPTKADDQEEVYRKYNVERGRRLVELGGCSQCHTPKIKTALGYKPDKDLFLSGYPSDEPLPDLPYAEIIAGEAENKFYTTDATIWVGRWGVSFAPNLTPDPETGIGNLTEEDFIEIFRGNKHFAEGAEVVSPMPVNVYSQLSFFELRSIFIYLQTIEPIPNDVPARIPPESDLFEGKDT